MHRAFLVLAALIPAVPSLAAAAPLLKPTRDVEVEYRTSGMPAAMTHGMPGNGGAPAAPGASGEGTLTIHYAAATRRLRIEGPLGRGYAIVDGNAKRMIMVMTQQQMYMEMPREVMGDRDMFTELESPNAQFTRLGTETIAGLRCTNYDVSNGERKGQICLTEDGVWLRARGNEGDHRREMEAVKVTYVAQPAALFEPPPDFKKFEMPTMPGGMPPGMAGPGMSGPRGQTPVLPPSR